MQVMQQNMEKRIWFNVNNNKSICLFGYHKNAAATAAAVVNNKNSTSACHKQNTECQNDILQPINYNKQKCTKKRSKAKLNITYLWNFL